MTITTALGYLCNIKVTKVHHYQAFGLHIASQVPFPEFYPVPEQEVINVWVTLGEAPQLEVETKGYFGHKVQLTSQAFRLTVDSVAQYHVASGNRVIIQPYPDASWDSIRLFCLSNAFAALLQQRRLIPLHCAALEQENGLLLIFGHSGAGKSTLFGGLVQAGWKPFSDDVCVPVMEDDGRVRLYASYPMMKFWEPTLKYLGWEDKAMHRLRPGVDKFGVFFHEAFETRPLKPSKIIILEQDEKIDIPAIKTLQGIERFRQLEAHAYRSEFLPYADLKVEHFRLFAALANQTDIHLLRRPKTGNSLNALIDLVTKI